MMKNLEVKVELRDLNEISHNIKLMGLKKVANLYQTDTYYLVGKKRLKLRNVNDELQLIYYSRPNVGGSKMSHYYIFRFRANSKEIIEKILGLFFSIKTVVIKKRMLYVYKHTRIHLDEVENLGKFLELETVFDRESPQNNFYKEHDFIVNTLGLSKYKKIGLSYSDLVFK